MKAFQLEIGLMGSVARAAYHRLPYPLRMLIWPIRQSYWIVLRAVQKLRTSMWIIEGECGPEKLSIVCAVSERSKNYIADLVFGGQYNETNLGRTWFWNVLRRVRKHACICDMLFVGAHRKLIWLLGRKRGFFIPCWVGGEVDMTEYSKKDSTKTDIRLIRRLSLECQITRDWEEFDSFYKEMYMPHIETAYEDRAFLLAYTEMKMKAYHCELYLVRKDGESIGGALVRYGKDVPRIWSYGVKDGNRKYLVSGAIYASTYFAIRHLGQKGFKRVHFGGSRPFLKDGVLRFKIRRGLKLTDSTRHVFFMVPLTLSEGLKKFLIENPFIYQTDGKLSGAVFVEREWLNSDEAYRKLYKDNYIDGLNSITIHTFGKDGGSTFVPADLAGILSVRRFEYSLEYEH